MSTCTPSSGPRYIGTMSMYISANAMFSPVMTSTSGWCRWWHRHHPLVLVITGLNIAFALMYMLIVPMYRGPDEGVHVDMIRHYRATSGEPSPNHGVRVQSVVRNVLRDGTLEKSNRP